MISDRISVVDRGSRSYKGLMTSTHDEHVPPELLPVAAELRDERPVATAAELDRVWSRVRSHRGRGVARQKGAWLRSRLALTTMLVVGLFLSTAGAGLAISGISDSDSAGIAQYVSPGEDEDDEDVGAVEDRGEPGEDPGEAGEGPGAEAQVPAQAGAAGERSGLPFTGLAAIPLLVIGVVLLIAGVVLSRSTRRGLGR
jgi:hypothetical protein